MKNSRDECAARLFEFRQTACWIAFLDLVGAEIETARDKLEKAGPGDFQKVQGKAEALRRLQKLMLTPPATPSRD